LAATTILDEDGKRIELLGEETEWLDGVRTEENWSRLVRQVNLWQEEWEDSQGVPFVQDWDLAGYQASYSCGYKSIEA
jgi:hypothetical protein